MPDLTLTIKIIIIIIVVYFIYKSINYSTNSNENFTVSKTQKNWDNHFIELNEYDQIFHDIIHRIAGRHNYNNDDIKMIKNKLKKSILVLDIDNTLILRTKQVHHKHKNDPEQLEILTEKIGCSIDKNSNKICSTRKDMPEILEKLRKLFGKVIIITARFNNYYYAHKHLKDAGIDDPPKIYFTSGKLKGNFVKNNNLELNEYEFVVVIDDDYKQIKSYENVVNKEKLILYHFTPY